MIPLSAKELIEQIEELTLDNISEIVTVEYNGIMNSEKAKEFPKLYIYMEDDIAIGENINEITLGLWFCDVQISKNDEWVKDKEIKSDMLQAASKLMDLLQREGFQDSSATTATPFSHDMNDGLAGVLIRPTFEIIKPCIDEV